MAENKNHEPGRLFHVSEDEGIKTFIPRPSPSYFNKIKGDVVFAVSEMLLHNYLLPRDCPRVTYYATAETLQADKEKFFKKATSEFVMAIEEKWMPAVQQTRLYIYEFPTDGFELLDACAGYYISYEPVTPISLTCIINPFTELLKRKDIDLRILPALRHLTDEVAKSSLNFSLIRLRNAVK